jgi:hypothetical protein
MKEHFENILVQPKIKTGHSKTYGVQKNNKRNLFPRKNRNKPKSKISQRKKITKIKTKPENKIIGGK